jgi:hypothetical protein
MVNEVTSNRRLKNVETTVCTTELAVCIPVSLRLSTIANLVKHKLSGSDQILANLIQAGGEILLRSINSLILFGIRKNYLISGRSIFSYQFTRKVIKVAVVIIMGYHCCQLAIAFSQG